MITQQRRVHFARYQRKLLFQTFRAALKGNADASYALVWLALGSLESRKLPSKGVHRYFMRIISDPVHYAAIVKRKSKPRRRGRPSIDDRPALIPQGFKLKKFFGTLPSEKNAQMIAYMLSQGHLINDAGNHKESAVELVAQVTGRSPKSLQNDYYKHKSDLNSEGTLELGKARYDFYFRLKERYDKSSSQ